MVHRKRVNRHSGSAPRGSYTRARGLARLTRRRFAALAGVLPAAVSAPARDAADVDAFRRFSAALTGFPAAGLDVEFARNLLQALKHSGRAAAVDALIRGEDIRDRASLETEIVSAWYSGLLPSETGPVVATVRDALVWRALGFASPPGACATAASWGEPPPGEKR